MNLIHDKIKQHPDVFSNEFIEWFPDNFHVWHSFVIETFKVHQKGYKHYSARTIVEVLRHHSAVSENGSQWKINDHHAPYLARLFDLVYPNKAGLFEYRKTKRKSNEEK